MSAVLDPLLNPYRPDLAAAHLEGRVAATRFASARRMQVDSATAPVHAQPRGDSEMISEALHGETVDVYDEDEGWAWGQLCGDGYVGYLPVRGLNPTCAQLTHKVAVPRTFVYRAADIKSVPAGSLTLNAGLSIEDEDGDFLRTGDGAYIFRPHAVPIDDFKPDFVAVAEALLGAPYLWGGKSVGGIDCSGLIQISCQSAGIPVLRDTYMQRETLGKPLDAVDLGGLVRGDIMFWTGHVGIMTDPRTLLHASAHVMLTITEPVQQAVDRIGRNGLDVLQVNRLMCNGRDPGSPCVDKAAGLT